MSPYETKNPGVDQADNVQYKSVSQLQDGPQSQEAYNADTLASQVQNEALGQGACRSSNEVARIQDEHQNEVHVQVANDNHKKGVNKNIKRDTKPPEKDKTKHEHTDVSNPRGSLMFKASPELGAQGATDPPAYQSSLKGSSKQQPQEHLSSTRYHHSDLEANSYHIDFGPESNGKFTKHQNSGDSKQAASLDTNSCVFCLDGGVLIHMCSCSVVAHKKCALDYIRFPGGMNENCCQCRRKLEYSVLDKKTPMRNKDAIAFLFLVIVYLTIIGLSVYCTILLIPQGDKNIYMWIAIVGNLSILWPLIIVYIFTLSLGCYSAYRYRQSESSPILCGGSGCYCGDGCGDCGDCNNCDGGGGEGCGMIICVICFLAVFAVLIAASAYLVFSLFKFYKSFSLKSKKEIVFKHEGRQLNTLG